MSHHPYPNAERARRQLDRHDDETGPYREPRPVTPLEEAVVGYARAAVQAAVPAVAAMVAAFTPHPAPGEGTAT